MTEEQHHSIVNQYLRVKYPDVIFLTDASGVRMTPGLAKKFSLLKSGKGIPDIIILEPRGGYHGLMIELKKLGVTIILKDGTFTKNKHIREQAAILDRLKHKGYMAVFAVGSNSAIEIIDEYLSYEL